MFNRDLDIGGTNEYVYGRKVKETGVDSCTFIHGQGTDIWVGVSAKEWKDMKTEGGYFLGGQNDADWSVCLWIGSKWHKEVY